MALDLTKPLRLKSTGLGLRYLGTLEGHLCPIVCAYYSSILPKHETSYQFAEHELENVPESKWLNVYEGDFFGPVRYIWHSTRNRANAFAKDFMEDQRRAVRVGVIEDKQDGSPLVFHDLREKSNDHR